MSINFRFFYRKRRPLLRPLPLPILSAAPWVCMGPRNLCDHANDGNINAQWFVSFTMSTIHVHLPPFAVIFTSKTPYLLLRQCCEFSSLLLYISCLLTSRVSLVCHTPPCLYSRLLLHCGELSSYRVGRPSGWDIARLLRLSCNNLEFQGQVKTAFHSERPRTCLYHI